MQALTLYWFSTAVATNENILDAIPCNAGLHRPRGVADVYISHALAVTPGHTVLCFSLLVLVMDASCALYS
jgi:hypothetical protein